MLIMETVMKTFNKVLKMAALAGALTSGTAMSNALYIDTAGFFDTADAGADVHFGGGTGTGINGDGNSLTGLLEGFTLDGVTPVSTYIDDYNATINPDTLLPYGYDADPSGNFGDGVIGTGDSVTDVISNLPLNLFPSTAESEGYGYQFSNTWSMDISWELSGSTVVLPDASGDGSFNYLGNFTSGTVSFDITDNITNNVIEDALVLGLTGTNGNPTVPEDNGFLFTLFLDVQSALPGIFFTGSGVDYSTLSGTDHVVEFTADAGLTGLNEDPNLNPAGTNTAGFDTYTRTTSLQSVDIRLVPEPSTLAVFGLALLGLAATARRKA